MNRNITDTGTQLPHLFRDFMNLVLRIGNTSAFTMHESARQQKERCMLFVDYSFLFGKQV